MPEKFKIAPNVYICTMSKLCVKIVDEIGLMETICHLSYSTICDV